MIMGGGGGGGGGGNGAVALKVDIEGPDTRDLRGFGECPSPSQVWSLYQTIYLTSRRC